MFNEYCTSMISNSMARTSSKHIRESLSDYGEYVCGLVSDCHGRLGQDDAIQVELRKKNVTAEGIEFIVYKLN